MSKLQELIAQRDSVLQQFRKLFCELSKPQKDSMLANIAQLESEIAKTKPRRSIFIVHGFGSVEAFSTRKAAKKFRDTFARACEITETEIDQFKR